MAGRHDKKAKCAEALRKCDNDPHVILAVSLLFWKQSKIAKCRKWFHRAVGIDGDFGDAWGAFYKFELSNGSETSAQKILSRCVAADPKHGRQWCSVSKAPGNRKLGAASILKKVAERYYASP